MVDPKSPTAYSVVEPLDALTWRIAEAEGFTVVEVFYGTDRAESGSYLPAERYGSQRGDFHYGRCQVSIPEGHEPGELEEPKWYRWEFEEDPAKHVVLMGVQPQEEGSFFEVLRARVAKATNQEAFVFVHGYNVSFEDAARRTAQIAFDVKFDGVPLFFSWPSTGELLGYGADDDNIEWAIPHLRRFLEDVARRSGARTVHLIAHSMGNQGLTKAFVDLVEDGDPEVVDRFEEIILAAPDVDADVFRRDIAPRLTTERSKVTLYTSSKDRALKASASGRSNQRVGDRPAFYPGIETLDASSIDTDFLSHSYYGSELLLLKDIEEIFQNRRPPDERPWLSRMQLPDGEVYWVFREEGVN